MRTAAIFHFCDHFRCDPQALQHALCKRMMITREEVIERSLDPLGATISRDGLAKTIYSRLFDWCVSDLVGLSLDLFFFIMKMP